MDVDAELLSYEAVDNATFLSVYSAFEARLIPLMEQRKIGRRTVDLDRVAVSEVLQDGTQYLQLRSTEGVTWYGEYDEGELPAAAIAFAEEFAESCVDSMAVWPS